MDGSGTGAFHRKNTCAERGKNRWRGIPDIRGLMLPWLSNPPCTVHVVMYSPLGHQVTVSHNLQGLPSSPEGPPTTLQNHHEPATVDANRPREAPS